MTASTLFSNWSLAQWLDYLETRGQDTAIGPIKLGLKRIKQVAMRLDLLSPTATVITVAGTNGKGTTVAALESIYQGAGYQVGVYTSPHLLKFNERIKVNGQSIRDEALCELFQIIEHARGAIHLTYFETVTLAGLMYFKQCGLDLIILEVGMGGRLDATNIIDSDLAIITTIDFDHQAFLGNTLDQIGFEKAGILRPGQPCIYSDDHKPPQSILACAAILACPMYLNGSDYHYHLTEGEFVFTSGKHSLCLPTFQWHPHAIAGVLMATIHLQALLPMTDELRIKGIQSIALSGRQQRIAIDDKTIICDVSHNAQSVLHLTQTLRTQYADKKIHAIFSALTDKDIDGLLLPMQPVVDYWYPALLSGERAASPEQLDSFFRKYDMIVKSFYQSPWLAYQDAFQQAVTGDLIVVYGSFLTVSDILRNLTKE